MHLAYLLPAPGVPLQGPSGASAHARQLVAALREEHRVDLYAACRTDRRGEFGPAAQAVITGVSGWPSWLARWRELREVRAARALSRRVLWSSWFDATPDLVVERHSLFSDAGWRVADRLECPWVLEVNAPPVEERSRFEELRQPELARRWEREVLLAAPLVVTVSRWLKRWLESEVGCRQVVWVPNGTAPLRGDRARGRAALGLDEDDFAMGFVGSMKRWHGVDRLPGLAQRAGARLVLVGAGEVELPASEAPGSGSEATVRTGYLAGQDLADAVAALDVAVAPYAPEAPPWVCPLKVFDYRAQGTPIVATDVGDVGVFVGSGGTVVPPGDDDAFVDAVRSWRGRRLPPRVRGWDRVGREVIEAAQSTWPHLAGARGPGLAQVAG